MHLTKFIVFFITALITKICLATQIIETSRLDESELVDVTVNILESCYIDRISTVGVAGVSIGSISKALSSREPVIPVAIIDETSKIANDSISTGSRVRLQFFVITVINSTNLAKTLIHIKSSIWWNHMASVLLLDSPASKHNCSNAFEMLWEAWKMDLINTKFMCLHETRGRLIYTYNPFSGMAPVPWQLVNTYKEKNNNIWSWFVQVYRKDKELCEILDFDKTTHLGEYEIRASYEGASTWYYGDPKNEPNILNRVEVIYAQSLISALKAKWDFVTYPENDDISVDENGNPYGEIADIVSGTSGMEFNFINQYASLPYTTTYPHIAMDMTVITQYRGHLTQLEKIGSVLDTSSHIGLLLVCLITFLFFKFFLREPLMPAFLNLCRITFYSSLLKISDKLAPRIYLGSLFIFALTIQGIYQGQLASLLTKEVPLPNVNVMQDLARFGHTIYGHSNYFSCFNESSLNGRYVAINKFNCSEYVVRDPKAACAATTLQLYSDAEQFKLHLAEGMMHVYMVYLIRENWPLEERVNTVSLRCFEGGVMKPRFMKELHRTLHAVEAYENRYENQTFQVLVLGDLIFAFVLLGIGLVCATISFGVEIGIDRWGIANSQSRILKLIRSIK